MASLTINIDSAIIREFESQIKDVETEVLKMEDYIQHLELSLNCFFTGNIPDGATLEQVLLAQWGRRRLDAKTVGVPKLLQKELF